MRHALLALAAVAVISFAAAPASAQTCGFTIADVSFGASVDTLSGSDTDTTATLQYTCSGWPSLARILICVSFGDGSVAASGSQRRMQGGGSYLLYQLYQNSERSVVWGSVYAADPPAAFAAAADGTGAVSGERSIYARVFGGQSTADATTYGATFTGGDVDIRYRQTADNECAADLGESGGAVSFNVGATVPPNCMVTTSPVNFGTQGILATNIDATGSVSVTCTPAATYSIRLNGGNAAAAPMARKMSKGSDTITYGLYRNSERDQPWGDTEGTTAAGIGSGGTQTHTVYGRVGPQPTPPIGTYADTVVVVVDY